MERELSEVTVIRADKAGGEYKRQVYMVPYEETKNVMQVLLEIYGESDRSLAFRRNRCNRGMCGACTMIINGSLKRACMTSMTRKMTIEPAGKYELIKDLAVDFRHPGANAI